MIRSGLDWSGDGGDIAKRGSSARLITVITHIEEDDLPLLDAAFNRVRTGRRLPPDYRFKYSGSRPAIRSPFFEELSKVPVSAHAVVIDKREWSTSYLRGSSGRDRISDSIVKVAVSCADHLVAGQLHLIDAAPEEITTVNDIRVILKRVFIGMGRKSFARVKPCADHRRDGAIVQVADMIAGALQDAEEDAADYLHMLRRKIKIV